MKLSEITHFCFEWGGRWCCPTRYWNTGGFAGAVVAVLNFYNDELFDWAAYIGGCSSTRREKDAERWIVEHGEKVSMKDAGYFFPDLPIGLYRL